MKKRPPKRPAAPGLYALAVENLYPGYFALVMATGIISSAARLLSFTWLSQALLWLNVAFFAVLWILTVARLVSRFPRLWADLGSHSAGPGFFTTVAGTCVLGTQLVVVRQTYAAGLVLWVLGLVLWVVLTYAFAAAVMTRGEKPDLGSGIHGGWLVMVVATQSVSVLASVLSTGGGMPSEGLLFAALCFCLAGGLLYLVLITLLFHRLFFHALSAKDLSPLSWIAMGAAAITTLAGARLLADGGKWRFLAELEPFLRGYTLLFWSIATWWIPLLLVLGGWRHGVRRFPVRYEPQYWSVVFPLGMYTACTIVLARATGLFFLEWVPRVSLWIAVAAWVAAFVGMAYAIVKGPGARQS